LTGGKNIQLALTTQMLLFECSQQKTINPWSNCHADLQWHSTPKATGGQCHGHTD